MEKNLKELQLKDLCARLPYGVICEDVYGNSGLLFDLIPDLNAITLKITKLGSTWTTDIDKVKPYLRPQSSMTEEEKNECFGRTMTIDIVKTSQQVIDWLLKNHFDFRGLIEKDLALPAPEGMYEKIK